MRNSKNGRFRVWDREVDAFNSADLVYNFDAVDWLFGGRFGSTGGTGDVYSGNPSTWLGQNDSYSGNVLPGTKNGGFEDQASGARTLYSVVSGLNYNDVPLGTVIQWWRPSSSIDAGSGPGAIPDGWVPCDGRSLTSTEHSYGNFNITVPDLRNKFVLGADPTVKGINAVGGYTLEDTAVAATPTNNDWTGSKKADGTTGAPGVGYDAGIEIINLLDRSGDNAPRNLIHNHDSGSDVSGGLKIRDHVHENDHRHKTLAHNHPLQPHDHAFVHQHFIPNHAHNFESSTDFNSRENVPGDKQAVRVTAINSGGKLVAPDDHYHKIDLNKAKKTGDREPLANLNVGYPTGWNSAYWNFPAVEPSKIKWPSAFGPLAITSSPMETMYSTKNGITSATTETVFQTNRGHIINASLNPGLSNFNRTEIGGADLLTTPPYEGGSSTSPLGTILTGIISGGDYNTMETSKGLDGHTADGLTESTNILPQYVGLLYLIKVRVSKNLI